MKRDDCERPEWFPFSHGPDSRIVSNVAAMTGQDRMRVLGQLAAWCWWLWFKTDRPETGMTPAAVETMLDFVPSDGRMGLVDALADPLVAWLRIENGQVIAEDWERWCSNNARVRMLAAKRAAAYRRRRHATVTHARDDDVMPVTVQSDGNAPEITLGRTLQPQPQSGVVVVDGAGGVQGGGGTNGTVQELIAFGFTDGMARTLTKQYGQSRCTAAMAEAHRSGASNVAGFVRRFLERGWEPRANGSNGMAHAIGHTQADTGERCTWQRRPYAELAAEAAEMKAKRDAQRSKNADDGRLGVDT